MSVWDAIELAAWILSALIVIYFIVDAVRVSREYDEEFLTTAIEIDESPEEIQAEGEGGAR